MSFLITFLWRSTSRLQDFGPSSLQLLRSALACLRSTALLFFSFPLSLQGKPLKLKWQAGPNAAAATATSTPPSSPSSSCVNQHLVALEEAAPVGQFAKAGTRRKRTHAHADVCVDRTSSPAKDLLASPSSSLVILSHVPAAAQLREGKKTTSCTKKTELMKMFLLTEVSEVSVHFQVRSERGMRTGDGHSDTM